MPVPNTFANATATIPLSQLDANFATTITLGNTAIQLGNTVSTLNNMTLANVTVTSGNVTITNVSVTTANVATANVTTSQILNYGTANQVQYLNASKALTGSANLTFDGTTFTHTGASNFATSTGNVGIGTSSPSQLVHMRAANPFLLVEGTAASTGETGVYLKANNNEWILRADNNGSSNFFGIKLGNPSSSSNTFLINSGGTVILSGGSTSATGVGITFPATQSASSNANTLDDYEEGDWTPVWQSQVAGTGRVTTNFGSRYIKIGKMVYVFTFCSLTTLGTGGSGNWYINGLPFAVASGNNYGSLTVGYFDSLNANVNYIVATAEVGSTTILLRGTTAAAATISNLAFSTYAKAGSSIIISGCYETA